MTEPRQVEVEVSYDTTAVAAAFRAMAMGFVEMASLFNETIANLEQTAQMLEDLATGELNLSDYEGEDDDD